MTAREGYDSATFAAQSIARARSFSSAGSLFSSSDSRSGMISPYIWIQSSYQCPACTEKQPCRLNRSEVLAKQTSQHCDGLDGVLPDKVLALLEEGEQLCEYARHACLE